MSEKKAELTAAQENSADEIDTRSTGTLRISVISSVAYIPIEGATVTIS